jgi:hypothetical protein
VSLFNFNPSGFLGSSAFAFEPSEFNFSNISAPAPKTKTVSDPVDVVSDKTPTPEVEILEGAGTIAVTAPADMISILEKSRLAGDPFSVSDAFVQSDLAQRASDRERQGVVFGVGEDLEVEQARGGTPRFVETELGGMLRSNIQSGGEADLRQFQDQGTANRLAELGLQGRYEQDQYRGYNYNPQTGQYDYYDNTPSVLEQAVPALIQAGVMGVATAGLGGALAGGLGVGGSAVGTGVANAVVNAGVQQALTGDIDWTQAALSGFSAGAEAYTEAAETAQEVANNLQNIAETGNAGERAIAATQVASATQKANEMMATVEVINNVQTGIDVVEAVEDKEILKAVDLGLSLAGSPSVSNIVKDNLTNAGVSDNYLDTATSTVIKAADTAIKGGDVGDVVQAAVNNALIETVATEDSIRKTFNLDTTGFDDTLTKTLSSLAVEALEGGNREEILGKGLESFIKNLPESDSKSPDYLKAVEDWWHENIEDPFENWWQTIEPQREVIEQAFNDTVETVKQVGQNAIDTADTVIRAIPVTKEQLNEFEDTVRNLTEEPAEQAFQYLGDIVESVETPDLEMPSLFSDSLLQSQEKYGNIIGYDDGGMPIYDTTIETLANQLLTNQN